MIKFNNIMFFFIIELFLIASPLVFSKEKPKLAVLHFDNNAESKYDSFVHGLPGMLTTSLVHSKAVILVERLHVEKAIKNFKLEQSGLIHEDKAIKVGQWLGATVIIIGNFTEFGGKYRIDARLIQVTTGELLAACKITANEHNIIEKIDTLGSKIIETFSDEIVQNGLLEINFRITYAPLTERPVYFQLCKLFVDGKYSGLSSGIREVNNWGILFSIPLKKGPHEIKIIHGYVDDKEDIWINDFNTQPHIFLIEIETNSTFQLKYEFHIGRFKDQFNYLHDISSD